MRTNGEVIKTSLAGGLLIAVFGVTLWGHAGAAETAAEKPTLRKAFETRAQLTTPLVSLAGVPDDEFNRGTPRTSLIGFVQATRERNFERAARYLDLGNLPAGLEERDGPQLARQLRIVVGRQLWIDFDTISMSPDGDPNDGLPERRDRIGQIFGATKSYDIVLQRVPREDGVLIWKFAASTIADIPQLYAEFGFARLETVLPQWFFDYRIIGIEVVLWAAWILISIAAWPLAMLLTTGLIFLVRRFHADLAADAEQFFTGPTRMLIWVWLVRSFMYAIHTSVIFESVGRARTLLVVALAWMVLRVLDLIAQRIAKQLEAAGLSGSKVLLQPIARLAKLVVLVGSVLLWLENLGYEITTLLAGLSISGVAVALASQKTLENIFGALTLFTSQPVRVGDFCRFGDKVGTVEEIGLRATRIRTLDRSVITVANGEFANLHLDNYSKRDRFWYHPEIGLRYETTPDQIRYILVEVQKMLYAHPKVLPEPLWVRFLGFGEYSLNVGIFAYIGVTDYTQSLEVAEDLNLRIMDIVAAAGSDFAFPAQIQYELPGKPVDEARVRAVEGQVKEWKAQKALYLPNLPKEKITKLRGSLEYPPQGSPEAAVKF